MLYAEMKIQVYYDEDRSTEEQRRQAKKADSDISQEHPIENGIGDLRDTIERTALQRFEYLGKGIKAVSIKIE